jgi:hypothetical protein
MADPVARLVEDVSAALLDHLNGDNDAIRSAAKDAIKTVFKHHSCEEVTQEFRLQNDREWREKLDHLKAENHRLRDGLLALAHPSDAPNGVLRSIAYDIVMNSMDGETAKYQIERRTRLHAEKCEQLERVLQAANALAEHCERGVNVGPVSLAPATEAALWINLRNALDQAK